MTCFEVSSSLYSALFLPFGRFSLDKIDFCVYIIYIKYYRIHNVYGNRTDQSNEKFVDDSQNLVGEPSMKIMDFGNFFLDEEEKEEELYSLRRLLPWLESVSLTLITNGCNYYNSYSHRVWAEVELVKATATTVDPFHRLLRPHSETGCRDLLYPY